MEYPFSVTIKVRSYELDSFGHVNNAVYFQYLEFARCEYMQQRGLSFRNFHEWKAFPFVIKSEITYKSPAQVDDLLDIRGAFSSMKRSSFSIEYEIYNQSTGRVCAYSKMSFAFVNENEKLISIPDQFREKLR